MKINNRLVISTILLLFLSLLPQNAAALSCMDATGMIENYVSEESYVIFTATPTENKEHVKEKAINDDPNAQYDSGYTAQLLDISEAHKGSVPDTQWVYFERNGTWNYLCVGEPAPLQEEQLFIVRVANGLFELPIVAGVYESDSQIAKDIIEAFEESNQDFGEPTVYETNKNYWLEQLKDNLKEMAFLIEVRLKEWKHWLAS